MIVIALDEGGKFENRGTVRPYGCRVIGGPVFRCTSEDDIRKETHRLQRFFEQVCTAAGGEFPADLHYNRDETGRVINGESAEKVKNALQEALPAFMKGTGEWSAPNKKPNGKYGLYAITADGIGMGKAAAGGNMNNDDIAANRYEHMVYRVIENLLCYDRKLEDDENIRLDLATRVVKPDAGDVMLRGQLDTAGYGQKGKNGEKPDENSPYIVTDEAGFRTAIESMVTGSIRENTDFRVNVRSISYKQYYLDQGFLYLADTLCSVYQNAIGNDIRIGDALEHMRKCCAETVGKENIHLWAYCTADNECRKLVDTYRYGDTFSLLKMLYGMRKRGNAVDAAYDAMWFGDIEKAVSTHGDPLSLHIALEKLDDYLHKNGAELTIADSVCRTLEKQYTAICDNGGRFRNRESTLFELRKSQMTIANHKGDHDKAIDIYGSCMEVAQYVDVEEYIGLTNSLCVSLLDAGRYAEAEKLARDAVDYHKMVIDIKKAIYPDTADVFVSLGRSVSQLGQCLAFEGKYAEAAETFRQAEDNFGNSEDDRKRTRSYRLHALIEAEDKSGYEAAAKEYFCADRPAVQAKNAVDAGDKFALYVCMKAIWYFYRDSMSEKDILAVIGSAEQFYRGKPDEHPWEMILKYCALLLVYLKRNADGKAEELMRMAEESVAGNEEGILRQITEDGKEQFRLAQGGSFGRECSRLLYMYS